MGLLALPSKNAGVWIEFEHGDPDYPIWSGGWWGSKAELPKTSQTTHDPRTVFRTQGGQTITLDDRQPSAGITLETSGGQKIILSPAGIEIDDGNGGIIKLSGGRLTVNKDALEVK